MGAFPRVHVIEQQHSLCLQLEETYPTPYNIVDGGRTLSFSTEAATATLPPLPGRSWPASGLSTS